MQWMAVDLMAQGLVWIAWLHKGLFGLLACGLDGWAGSGSGSGS